MPPKRGRGRGGASATGALGRSNSQTAAEGASSDPATTHLTLSTFDTKTENVEPQVSPNSSPAEAPTETPASTPSHAPVQRLESLGSGIGGPRGSSRGARAGASTSRFKPKAVRRGAEEREKAAREEAERKAEREKEAAALARRGSARGRGDIRGRGGRGRGDAMGRGRIERTTGAASGPFSAAPAAPDRRPGMFAPGSGPKREGGGGGGGIRTGGSSSARIKSEPGMSHYTSGGGGGSGPRMKNEIPEPVYPEEQEEGEQAAPRIDIEQINLVTDDEDEDEDVQGYSKRNKGKGSSSSKGGLRPIRLAREEHKERVTMVNTEPAAAPAQKDAPADDGSVEMGGMFVEGDDGAEAARMAAIEKIRDADAKNFSGVWGDNEDDDTPHIKYDPDEPPKESIMLADAMEVDSKDTTPAPTAASGSRISSTKLTSDNSTSSMAKSKMKQRKSSNKGKKPVLQTEEDKAEYARQLEDVQILAEELGGMQAALNPENVDGEGNANMDEQHEVKDKEGRLYLFQFPPILPPLVNPVKKEEPTDNDVEMSGVPAAASGVGASDHTKPGNEQEEVIIKAEPGAFVAPQPLIPEEGFIGKLIVRQSGKVELDWGGVSLQLGKGANTDFLTTTMLVQEPEQGAGNDAFGGEAEKKGTGTGMGRVMGKFVVTPDWAALFENQK